MPLEDGMQSNLNGEKKESVQEPQREKELTLTKDNSRSDNDEGDWHSKFNVKASVIQWECKLLPPFIVQANAQSMEENECQGERRTLERMWKYDPKAVANKRQRQSSINDRDVCKWPTISNEEANM